MLPPVARRGTRRRRSPPAGRSSPPLAEVPETPWPGNVRELRHVVESAAILAGGEEIGPADLPATLSVAGAEMMRRAAASGMTLRDLEDAYIDEVLRRTRGNKSAAAAILGIHRKTLHDKLRARSRREDAP